MPPVLCRCGEHGAPTGCVGNRSSLRRAAAVTMPRVDEKMADAAMLYPACIRRGRCCSTSRRTAPLSISRSPSRRMGEPLATSAKAPFVAAHQAQCRRDLALARDIHLGFLAEPREISAHTPTSRNGPGRGDAKPSVVRAAERRDAQMDTEIYRQHVGFRLDALEREVRARQAGLKGNRLGQRLLVEQALRDQQPAERPLVALLFLQRAIEGGFVDDVPRHAAVRPAACVCPPSHRPKDSRAWSCPRRCACRGTGVTGICARRAPPPRSSRGWSRPCAGSPASRAPSRRCVRRSSSAARLAGKSITTLI